MLSQNVKGAFSNFNPNLQSAQDYVKTFDMVFDVCIKKDAFKEALKKKQSNNELVK